MANKVLLKKSSVSSRVPTTLDLAYGELALNYADGKLYFKTASNAIDTIGQDKLVSGTNIKTINGTSLLGSGDIEITSGGGSSAWVKKTSNYTAVSGDRLIADTSGGTFTVTLPST
jgi:hypothetical protein